jgi:CRISPR/Cas system endoribonuclease Cas6 (RAMP superfamily)
MLAPVQNDDWRKGVIMREALSVIIREMLNVIRSGCEGSVPVVGKTGKASFRAPAKNLSPWWGKP